jgi:hypothetical protein
MEAAGGKTRVLVGAAFALTVAASATALLAPLGREVTSTAKPAIVPSPGGPAGSGAHLRDGESVRGISLLEEQGIGVAVPLAIPVAVALVGAALFGFAARRRASRRRPIAGTAVAMGVWTLMELVSVGALYVPATVVLTVAAVAAGRGRPR